MEDYDMEKDLKELKQAILNFCKKYNCTIEDVENITVGRTCDGKIQLVDVLIKVRF